MSSHTSCTTAALC